MIGSHQGIVDAVGCAVRREERQKADIPFSVMLKAQDAHFLAHRVHRRIIIRCIFAGVKVYVPFDGFEGTVVISNIGVGIRKTDASRRQIFVCSLDCVCDPLHDEAIAFIIISGDAVDEVIQRVPGNIGRRGMTVCRGKHHIILGILCKSTSGELFQHIGLDALRHVHQLRRCIDDGLSVGLNDVRSGIQSHQQSFHQISQRIVSRGNIRDRPGNIRFADTDPHSSGCRSRSESGDPQCRDHGYYQKKADQILLNSFHFSSLTFTIDFSGSIFPLSSERLMNSL